MDIKELREKINGIDNQISKLFLKSDGAGTRRG